MKTYLATLWAALCGRVKPAEPAMQPPVLMKSGQRWKLMKAAELQAMKQRWQTNLQGQAQSPAVTTILEMIEHRIWQADMLAQGRKNHADAVGLVHYSNGESAGLNDLLTELVRIVHVVESPGQP